MRIKIISGLVKPGVDKGRETGRKNEGRAFEKSNREGERE